MSRALRLHERHTKSELAQMHRDLLADGDNRAAPRPGQIEILTPKARKLADDILLAIYWHNAPKGNTRMQSVAPQGRFW
jgi:hypothetical protein